MPYSLSPPAFSRGSKIVDVDGRRRASACAQARPAGPAPTTAMRLPVGRRARIGRFAGRHLRVDRVALQQADATGLPSAASRTQASSHSVSVGQTRAHMPPMMLESRIVLAAPSGFPRGDLADEQGNVDRGRAGLLARRVEAEIAALGLDLRLVGAERGMQVGEIGR